ncbi:MAG: amidohydrolase family protein [Actinomycetes bacterium]
MTHDTAESVRQVDAVRCGRFVDVRKGTVLDDVTLVLEGDRVAAVEQGTPAMPEGAHVLDLSDCLVAPGLVDLHSHLVGVIEGGSYAEILTKSEADEALIGVKHARDTLRAGFTSVRDVGTFRAFADVALKRGIEAGWFEGPRMRCAGAYITTDGGGGGVTGFAHDIDLPRSLRYGVSNSPDEVRRNVRLLLGGGADFIKVIGTGAVLAPGTTPGAPEFSEAEFRAAVEEAALYGTFVATHAHGAEGIKRAVRAGVRSIEHGSFADEESLQLMAEAGTYLVADVWCGDWIDETGRRDGWPEATLQKNTDSTETQRAAFSRAVELGVRIGFGTDSGVYPHGMNAKQLAVMVRLGLSPVNALRSATLWAAECMDDDLVGSLEPGRYADLVAVGGHDLGNLAVFADDVRVVVKGGRVVRGG